MPDTIDLSFVDRINAIVSILIDIIGKSYLKNSI